MMIRTRQRVYTEYLSVDIVAFIMPRPTTYMKRTSTNRVEAADTTKEFDMNMR